jgi:hypothetical protein
MQSTRRFGLLNSATNATVVATTFSISLGGATPSPGQAAFSTFSQLESPASTNAQGGNDTVSLLLQSTSAPSTAPSATTMEVTVKMEATAPPTTRKATASASAWATEAETTAAGGPATAALHFTAVLPLSMEAFAAVRPAYVLAVAAAAACSPEQVVIVSVSAYGAGGGRRADAPAAVAVETTIVMPAAAAAGAEAQGAPSSGALSAADIRVSSQDLDRSLQRYGLPQALSFRVLADSPGTATAALSAALGAVTGGNGTAANSTTSAGGSGGPGGSLGVLSVIVGCSAAGAVLLGAVAVRVLRAQTRKSGRISHFTSLEAVIGGGGTVLPPPPGRGGSGASHAAMADVELAAEMVADVLVGGDIEVGEDILVREDMGGELDHDRAAVPAARLPARSLLERASLMASHREGIGEALDHDRASDRAADHPGNQMGAADDDALGDTSAGRREPFSSGSPEVGCHYDPLSSSQPRRPPLKTCVGTAEGVGEAFGLDRAADNPGNRLGTDNPLSSSGSVEASSCRTGTAGDKSAGCCHDPLSSGSREAPSIRMGRLGVQLGEDIQLAEAPAKAEGKGRAAGDLMFVA